MNNVDVQSFWDALSAWSQATFGADSVRGPGGPLKHLIHEAGEALAAPGDLTELADCLFLVFDATRRSGFTLEQLVEAAWAKLEVNRRRTWPKPTSDEPVMHVREVTP